MIGNPPSPPVRFYIYALVDPRTSAVRYVGITTNPALRLASHRFRPASDQMRQWVRELSKEKLRPSLQVLATTYSREESARLENQFIDAYEIHQGGRLLNQVRRRITVPDAKL